MRIVIQRVLQASVSIEGNIIGEIGNGMLVLAGFESPDETGDLVWMANKIVQLRIFNDSNDVMNLSVKESGGAILLVSQFTLHAKTKKGNRPSYISAAPPDIAIPLYESFIRLLSEALGQPVQTGRFGADMKVSLVNDGPVTIIIDSKNRDL